MSVVRVVVLIALMAAPATFAAITFGSLGGGDDGQQAAPPATDAARCRSDRGFGVDRWPPACWRPYSDESPFNRRVPARPRLRRDSAAIVARTTQWGPPQNLLAGHSGTSDDYFHPLYWAQPDDPVFRIHCVRFGRCAVEGHRIRIPDDARPAAGDDGHMAVLDARTGWEYDFWQVQSKPAGGGELVVSHGGRTRLRGSGLGSNATAAWFGLAAGVIRPAELRAGRIDHALFMHVKCSAGTSVRPARRGATAAPCKSFGLENAGAPPLGARFWLDMSLKKIAALRVPRWKKTILVAMHRYGMIVGDTSGGNGAWGIQGESGASFTSFGRFDQWADVAEEFGVPRYGQGYVFPLAKGVDWAGHLRVLDPCVSRGRCR
jgi:hypothetical protein